MSIPAEIVLFEWFDIHPMGVEVCPGVDPPQEAWDALIKHLSFCNDSVCWQIAAACNKYPKKFRTNAYTLAATLFGCSEYTIQQYCYVERSIPLSARVAGLTIWQHRPVAKIDNPILQRNYLEECLLQGWSIGAFEDWLGRQGVEVEERHYQSDRQFESDRQFYEAVTELADTRRELAEAKQFLELSPKTIVSRIEAILELGPVNAARNIVQIFNELKAIIEELRQWNK